MRKSDEIREAFLKYFEDRGHQRVPSSSLVPARDPTLLFTNAGMNQFKDVFLGRETRSYARAASAQKCMRVSGKHNDLEQVGRTPRHHTFFEMLGNFSFGDYFKKDAIAYAWELMTKVYGIPGQRLRVTVFSEDEEARGVWRSTIGLADERITRLGEEDNFWSMGDAGPCGPCSEIHYDRGEKLGCGRPECAPGCDCGRFMELWNLVFMQFDRQPDGSTKPLQLKGVDTGMGLERIASVLQGVDSNYETDLLKPIVEAAAQAAERLGGVPVRRASEQEVALRVIADHTRAMVFLMSDGVIPSNEGRGYVLRRIMRRAIRHARHLGIEQPVLHELSGAVIGVMERAYPELLTHRATIAHLARQEEERFAETLAIGLQRVESLAQSLKLEGKDRLPGAEAFKLYDTFGLPLDLIREVAEDFKLALDEMGFEQALNEQRERSRRRMRESAPASRGVFAGLPAAKSAFQGYEATGLDDARVLAIVRGDALIESLGVREEGQVLLDRTPFYAEAGGQVGDTGFLTAPGGVAEVSDTQAPLPGLSLHAVVVREGRLRTGDVVRAEVDRERRGAVMRSHDATHLVHAALRDVVGTHVKQAGSLVNPDRFRFDFNHFTSLSEEILGQVEDEVNHVIRQDLPILTSEMPLDEALRRGALAFFGDKYGERVRVVEVPGFSMELCGGTHAASTGSIGLLKITQERGIAAGIRRVEAVSGEGALRELREDRRVVDKVRAALNVDRVKVHEALTRLLEQNRSLARELERLKITLAAGEAGASEGDASDIDGVPVVVRVAPEGLEKGALRSLLDRTRETVRTGVIVLWNLDGDRVGVLTSVSKDLSPRLHAGDLVRELGALIDGRGGGRAEFAEAGGRNVRHLDAASLRAQTLDIVRRSIQRARAAG